MNREVKLLAGLFTVSGIGHFVVPGTFEAIVPKPLPLKRELVLASGAVELACAALLVNSRTRRRGGQLSAVLLAAVFPANIQMAVDSVGNRRAPTWLKIGTVARLPMQYPMVRAAIRATKTTEGGAAKGR